MERKFQIPPKTISDVLTFRPTLENKRMLARASMDHPILSGIINLVLAEGLKERGYGRKSDSFEPKEGA